MAMVIKATVKEIAPMTVTFLIGKGHYNQIPVAFGALYGWIMEKGYKPRGPAIAVYHNMPGQVPDDELRWELRSQISADVAESGPNREGLGVKRLGAVRVAAVTHKGPYEKLEETFRALILWVEENGYETSGPTEELYLNDPAKVPTDELLTEIRFPVSRK